MSKSRLPFLDGRAALCLILVYPLGHFAAVWQGIQLIGSNQTAALWLSNGTLLAVLLLLRKKWWGWLLAGTVLAEAFSISFITPHLPLQTALSFSAANLTEAVLAAYLARLLVPGQLSLIRVRDALIFVFLVAPSAAAASATIATFGREILPGDTGHAVFWEFWWAANVLGILVVSPFILTCADYLRNIRPGLIGKPLEGLALVLLTGGLAHLAFSSEPGTPTSIVGLPYIIFPALIWSSLRFGPPLTTILFLLVTLIAVDNTNSGYGLFSNEQFVSHLGTLHLQVFLAVGAVSAIVLGAVISERHSALQEMRKTSDKFSKTFHATPLATCVCRADNGLVLEVNQSFLKFFGLLDGDLINKTLVQLELNPLEQRRLRFHKKVFSGPHHAPVDIQLPSGEVKHCELYTAFVVIDNQDLMVAVLHDLTPSIKETRKRQALELELMQAHKMEAIGQLAGGIAHDFNNILSAVIGYSELSELRASTLGDTTMVGYQKEIQRAGTRASEMILQLLTFSRKKAPEIVPVELQQQALETMGMLRPSLPSSLVVNTPEPGSPVHALADPTQLQQVILNLCINARDVTKGIGTLDIQVVASLDIRAYCNSCKAEFAGDYATLVVTDSGPGIPAELLDHLFEPFFTTKEVGEGTGLGLAVVHGAVHNCKGHIVVSSTPGRTSFAIHLPLLETKQTGQFLAFSQVSTENFADEENDFQLDGCRVLLVEDESQIAQMMATKLTARNMKVTVASSGAEALARFESEPEQFDLVISDQTMPHMTGIQLARRIKSIRPDLPFILCSGLAAQLDKSTIKEAGILACLSKPIKFSELLKHFAEIERSRNRQLS